MLRHYNIAAVMTDSLPSEKLQFLSDVIITAHLFGYLRNTWSPRSLAKCLTNELGIPISFKHLQRITKDLGIRC